MQHENFALLELLKSSSDLALSAWEFFEGFMADYPLASWLAGKILNYGWRFLPFGYLT
jgi:hypothetical protein